MHASRLSSSSEPRTLYKASSAVLLTEVGKLAVSLALAYHEIISRAQAQSTASLECDTPVFEEDQSAQFLPSGFGLGIVQSDDTLEEENKQSNRKSALYKSRRRAATLSQSTSHSRSTSLKLVPSSPEVDLRTSVYPSQASGLFMYQEPDSDKQYSLDIPSHPSPASSHQSVHQYTSSVRELYLQIFGRKFYRLSLPASLFAIQGNLQYIAVSNLSVPNFQVCAQLKILTTALFSIILLKRQFTSQQWTALVILALGAAIVQIQSFRDEKVYLPVEPDTQIHQSTRPLLGFISVCLMCLSSGFASTYFEKMLKAVPSPIIPSALPYHSPFPDIRIQEQLNDSYSRPPVLTPIDIVPLAQEERDRYPDEPVSLWIRNIQLGLFALVMAGVLCLVENGQGIWSAWLTDVGPSQSAVIDWNWRSFASMTEGFLSGFDGMTWFVIGLQISGGLLAALVMKHADNIAKNFATTFSILLSFAASTFLFDFRPSREVLLGASMVIGSTFMFNSRDQSLKRLIGLSA